MENKQQSTPRSKWTYFWAATICLLGLKYAVQIGTHLKGDRHVLPSPAGMVFRLEFPAVKSPFSAFSVERLGPDSSELVVRWDKQSSLFAFPSGQQVGTGEAGKAATRIKEFDFNGDGVMDMLETVERDRRSFVSVLSGTDGAVLFEDSDPFRYENTDRAYVLGDLDGDGCSELALLHPRMDESKFDFVTADQLGKVSSWVTVISGRLACE